MKNVVLQSDQTEQMASRAKIASQLALLFGATVEGVYIAPPTAYSIRAEVGIPQSVWENYRELLWEGESRSKNVFDEAMSSQGVEHEWVQPIQGGAAGLCHECMFADLVVLGQSANETSGKVERDLTDKVILNSRRPCLVVPSAYTDSFKLDRVVVAWNGSDESVHAVHSALAVLQQAGEVDVVQYAEDDASAADMQGLLKYLKRYDVNAKSTVITGPGDIGVQLLNYAKQHDHDLIVLGAYGHQRIREVLLGGVTRHILNNSERLVLVSH